MEIPFLKNLINSEREKNDSCNVLTEYSKYSKLLYWYSLKLKTSDFYSSSESIIPEDCLFCSPCTQPAALPLARWYIHSPSSQGSYSSGDNQLNGS